MVQSGRGRLALARGIYAVCVFGLVLNDHVFKQATWLPGWLTGKLSDFFGLVVAPLTLCAVFSATSRRRRAVCFALPATVFVATEVSSTAADALVAVLGTTGLSWRLWTDPTDLIALAVLPGAWILSRWVSSGERSRPDAMARWRAGVALGALACLGSGRVTEPLHSGVVYLVNRTDETVEVDVAELRGSLDCAFGAHFEPEFLRQDDFAAETRYALEPNEVIPFYDCAPVRVAFGGESVAIQWSSKLLSRRLPEIVSDEDLADERQLVFIERSGNDDVLRFGPDTERLVLADLLSPLPESTCEQVHVPRIEVSGTSTFQGAGRIVEKRDLGAGCFSLFLDESELASDAAGAGGAPDASSLQSIQLCVPESEFPFAVGDDVRVTPTSIDSLDSNLTMSWQPREVVGFPSQRELRAEDCAYVREPCGAIWQSMKVYYDGVEMRPGERRRVQKIGYGPVDCYLTRAMRPIVSMASGCGPGLARWGVHLELLYVEGRP